MTSEKIPCPVEGCDEVFDDEAAAAAHMKAEHSDLFSPPEDEVITLPPIEGFSTNADLSMVPPGLMEAMEKKMDARIEAALEAYLPQVQEAVTGAMKKVVEAQAQGALPGAVLGGGVIPGSPVTPAGAQLLNWITKQDQPTGMENLAATLTQARAISDVLNPPTIWDRVMQNAVLRSLGKAGLVTDSEMKELLAPPAKP